MITFAYPLMFFLLGLPVLVYFLLPVAKGVHGDALRITFFDDLSKILLRSAGIWSRGNNTAGGEISLAKIILSLIYILLVTAIARPQWVGEPMRIKNEGRDILLVMDISTSMLERDFNYQGRRLSRLQAIKTAAVNFVNKRKDDRIGLILFGSRAYLQAPLTYDKHAIKVILTDMDAGMAGNSTAIGDALGLALKTIREKDDKENKVIILLTDGENNDGSLSLPQAIQLAKNEKVKIYTIGIGNSGNFIQSILSYKIALPSGLDEQGLKALADEVGGKYFRAEDTASLIRVYDAINKLEPQEQEENYVNEVKEYYYIPLLGAIILSMILFIIERRKA